MRNSFPLRVHPLPYPRVLVVDDQRGTACLHAAMASDCNCDVKIATEGSKAVEIAEDWHPEIVLLDLMMPGMDGFEVAARLRTGLVGAKIVAVTALAGNDQRVQDAGFDRYLIKPVLKESVSQVIRQLTSN